MTLKKSLIAFAVISLLGVLFHFTYELSDENKIVGLFSAVNESIFEHQKLIFYPAIIYSAFEYFKMPKKYKNYTAAVTLGIISAIIFIITAFYTYSGIIGKSYTFVDIALFFIGVMVFLKVRNIIIKNSFFESRLLNTIAVISLIIMAVLFTVWTFSPPRLALFIPIKR